MHRLLLLEDDMGLHETLKEYLQEAGYSVDSAYDGHEAQDLIYENRYDLYLFDVKVPKLSGFDLLQDLRHHDSTVPAIYMTSLNSIEDLQRGYDSGCDDYVKKPFSLKELKLRIQALLKRTFAHRHEEIIKLADALYYDIAASKLMYEGTQVRLSDKQHRLLKLFLRNQDSVLSHERIMQELWDYDEKPSDEALRTYIKNLRKLLGKERIVSVKKHGYRFVR
ncbi:MAG: response regulator transcription factor [Campylobacterota bacterium]